MTEPAEYDAKTTAAVTLAGRKWPIPELGVRQLRYVRRPLLDLTKRLADTDPSLGQSVLLSLTTEEYESLVVEVVFQGLTRAHPSLTRDEFLDMAISDVEMTAAWLVVRRQSGVFVFGDSAQDAPVGEAMAAETKSQTGN